MTEAYAGIDVAFRKNKRLPIVVCTWRAGVLEQLALRSAAFKPPSGAGNEAALDQARIDAFVAAAAEYVETVEREFGVEVTRIAIDAPSSPRAEAIERRRAERALDLCGISSIGTPNAAEFEQICSRARFHLSNGRSVSSLPGANQLWMLVGFSLFRTLRKRWDCFEVYPHAIVSALDAGANHKSTGVGLAEQLAAVARQTRWPRNGIDDLRAIGYGSRHDRLDAYLAAWVASLDERQRRPLGQPPDDVIWVPELK